MSALLRYLHNFLVAVRRGGRLLRKLFDALYAADFEKPLAIHVYTMYLHKTLPLDHPYMGVLNPLKPCFKFKNLLFFQTKEDSKKFNFLHKSIKSSYFFVVLADFDLYFLCIFP